MMDKDEVSDLQSLISRLVECTRRADSAKQEQDEAQRQLNVFLHYQQYPKKVSE